MRYNGVSSKKRKEIGDQQDKSLMPSSDRPLTPNNTWLMDIKLRLPTPFLIAPV